MEYGCGDVYIRWTWTIRCPADIGNPGTLSHQYLLRAADRLPAARPGGSEPLPIAALRHCIGAGEPLNPEVIEAWQRGTGQTIRDGYGQTETAILVANFPPLPVKPGSMGKPSPGFTIAWWMMKGEKCRPARRRYRGQDDAERPIGMFSEYWRNPEATTNCSAVSGTSPATVPIRDEDGYFWFVGRADDVIISAGYRIGPFEVESALVEHPPLPKPQ